MVLQTYKLQQCDMSKKEFKEWMMGYSKRIARYLKENYPDRLATFKQIAQEQVPKLIKMHSEFVLFMGESMDYEGGGIVMEFWKPDDPSNTPYFYFLKDGHFLGE